MRKKRKLLIGVDVYALAGAAILARYYRPLEFCHASRRAGRSRANTIANASVNSGLAIVLWPVCLVAALERDRKNYPWTASQFRR